jgi:hypothetical protein
MQTDQAPGLLVVVTDLDPAYEADVNRWYDSRHVPQRRALPGFRSAQRYIAVEGQPKYLALYDLDSPDAMKTDAYRALSRPPVQTEEDRTMLQRFRNSVRAVMVQVNSAGAPGQHGGVVLAVGLDPDPAYEEEFNAWYAEEHIPCLTSVSGVLGARRFRAVEGSPAYLTLWELESPEVRRSAAYRAKADTPWTRRMRAHFIRRLDGIYQTLS